MSLLWPISIVFCQILSIRALRSSGEVQLHNCTFIAEPSNSSEFDVNSLIFARPDFTFLESREFFVSPDANCQSDLEIPLSYVPNSTKARRLQQEQRFQVKQIVEGLNAAKKQNLAHASKVVEQFTTKSREPIPLVELHMFPHNPLELNSTWFALVVPKSKKLFGATVYLCRPGLQKSQCVAELPFEKAPLRLLRGWDWALDPVRTIPHGKLLCWEIALATGITVAVCLALYILLKLLLSWRRKDAVDVEEALAKLEVKSYKLGTHAKVHRHLGDGTGTTLDACHEVCIVEVQCSDKIFGSTVERLIGYAKSLFFSKPQRVWGRLEEPEGWIVLFDGDFKVILDKDKAPYRANQQLMIPLASFIRRALLLAASHSSAQWFLLEKFAGLMDLQVFILVVLSFFSMHLFVLYELGVAVQWGVYCDEVLEQERQRLRPKERNSIQNFSLIVLALAISFLMALCRMNLSELRLVVSSSSVPLVAIAVHSMELKACCTGLEKWREPLLSSEFTEFPGERLPTKVDGLGLRLSKKREIHFLLASLVSLMLAAVGLGVLIMMSSDGIKMQGTLLDYSFSEGHQVYLSQSTALQNTLLLHDSIDAVSFVFEKGSHTKNLTLKLEHLQLENRSLSVPLPADDSESNQQLKYQLNLPQGPLYSRVTIEAESRLRIKATKYTFHILRVGEAIELSLIGRVGASGVRFMEHRLWQYQKQKAEWYVPELVGNSTVEVKLRSISFAPLEEQHGEIFRRPGIPHYGKKCLCDNDPAAENACLKEENVTHVTSTGPTSQCLFLRSVKEDIQIQQRRGSLSGEALVRWLQDVTFSGKRVRLRLDDGDEIKLAASNTIGFETSTVFTQSMSSALLMRGNQLVVGTSQAETDREEEALPFRVVPHPPPVLLKLQSEKGFLQPRFNVNNKRSEYFVCNVPRIDELNGSISDERFQVKTEVTGLGRDCFSEPIIQKRFRAVRTDSCSYCGNYLPWNDNYDILATLSPQRCFLEAIDLNDSVALSQTFNWFTAAYVKENGQSCDILQTAVRLDRLDMLEDLARGFPDCVGCKETALGVAAAEGKLEAMKRLLCEETQVKVNTVDENHMSALAVAVQACQFEAVAFLIQKGSDVNQLMPQVHGDTCWVTPLLTVFGQRGDAGFSCHAKDEEGPKKDHVARMISFLHKSGATFSVEGKDGCHTRTALIEAIHRKRLSDVELLLTLGANPNEKGDDFQGGMEAPLLILADQLLFHGLDWESFVRGANALLKHHADVNAFNEDGTTVLMKAAENCHYELVDFMLNKGASAEQKDGEDETAQDYITCRKKKETLTKITERLQKAVPT